MNNNSIAILRDRWEQLSTEQLDEMLLRELKKATPEGERVRLILDILKQRESGTTLDISTPAEKAWQRYQTRVIPSRPRTIVLGSWLWKAASVVLVLLFLTAFVPQETTASNFFQRIMAWTEDVFSLKSPGESPSQGIAYEFQTDNPGLQEVYDQVIALGVTTRVVPMWLPEGYELTLIETEETPTKTFLTATFSTEESHIVYQLDMYSDNITREYYKDESEIQQIEKNGIMHTIVHNKALLVAIWAADNIECSIAVDCQEDTLRRILNSIYTMEEH